MVSPAVLMVKDYEVRCGVEDIEEVRERDDKDRPGEAIGHQIRAKQQVDKLRDVEKSLQSVADNEEGNHGDHHLTDNNLSDL